MYYSTTSPYRAGECRTIMANFPVFQETEGEWTSVRTVGILGVRIPAYFTTDPQLLYDFITNFQTKPDDVFIVSYPKSGMLICGSELANHVKNFSLSNLQ